MFFFLNLRFLKLTFLLYDRLLVSKLLMLEDSKTKGLQFVNFFYRKFRHYKWKPLIIQGLVSKFNFHVNSSN